MVPHTCAPLALLSVCEKSQVPGLSTAHGILLVLLRPVVVLDLP